MPVPIRQLDRETCRRIAAAAFAPSPETKYGLECEWFTFAQGPSTPRPGYSDLLPAASTRLPAGSRVTIEPGGQLELSTEPLPSLGQTLDALDSDERAMRLRAERLGVTLSEGSVDTVREPELVLDSGRYTSMRDFWDATDGVGRWMMCNTASLQVNVSNSASDVTRQWRIGNALGPLLVAIFANSGGTDGQGRRWESLRQGIWSSMEPGRTAPLDPRGDPVETWLSYALNADVFFIRTDGTDTGVSVEPGLPFGRWLAHGSDWGWPTREDFAYHLTTLFPPLRPRGWLEFRMLDALPAPSRTAAAAITAVTMLDSCAERFSGLLQEASVDWVRAARFGLRDPRLRRAAIELMRAALQHLDELEAEPGRCDAARDFAERYTLRGRSPSFDSDAHLPIALGASAGRSSSQRRRGAMTISA